jgi:hypothetical protein
MPSYTIPEEIVGVPLFVPSANDFFSVDVGGLPNGEDCLLISGGTNRNYKAFMEAPTLTPNVFRSKTAVHSQVFWLKAPVAVTSNSNAGEHIMMCVQEVTDPQTNPAFSTGTWCIGAGGNVGRIQFKQGVSGLSLNIEGARTAGWKMVTITNNGTTIATYLDDVEAAAASGSIAGGAVTATGLVLCIGAYSDVGSVNSYEHDWRLGKWQFFDHVLNATERAILYHTMIS